jgi:hypothetical protein
MPKKISRLTPTCTMAMATTFLELAIGHGYPFLLSQREQSAADSCDHIMRIIR